MTLTPSRPDVCCPPILRIWPFVVISWPIIDSLRKWGSLNQPLYFLSLLTPFFIVLYLFKKKQIIVPRSIRLPSFLLAVFTGLPALYYSFADYSPTYIIIWLLNLSILILPHYCLCISEPTASVTSQYLQKKASQICLLVSIFVLFNNVLSVLQSLLGRNHPLSATAGGILEGGIGTNTFIELRAPGFFTAVNGNAYFTVVCTIFLLTSIQKSVSWYAFVFRALAILTIPIAISRTISRNYLLTFAISISPFILRIFKPRFLISVASLLSVFLFLQDQLPFVSSIIADGVANFSLRIDTAGGFVDGLLVRYLNSFFVDAGGSETSLFGNLGNWFREDPLAMLFGYGLGYASPLFRFVSGSDNPDYGYIIVNRNPILLGEQMYVSLLAEAGIVNFIVYIFLLIASLRQFLNKFSLAPFSLKRIYVYSSFIFFLLCLNIPYFRPANVLALTSGLLTPSLCMSLYDYTDNNNNVS